MDGHGGEGQTETYIQVAGSLFEAVQRQEVFEDSKTFVDCVPKEDPSLIMEKFEEQRGSPDFDLKAFVLEHFALPEDPEDPPALEDMTMEERILDLWKYLTMPPYENVHAFDTLIPMAHPYVVPGGRFREVYYWDYYFESEGLAALGDIEAVENGVKNIVQFISTYGFVPNANRTYYLSRSQPPFLSSMLSILERHRGVESVSQYIPYLEEEYSFWMEGREKIRSDSEQRTYRRTVRMADGSVLNRYWDDEDTPRPESYRHDVELARQKKEAERPRFFRDIRAGCESGWDFSSRWLEDALSIESIVTTDIVPVDLNAILYDVESRLVEWFTYTGKEETAEIYRDRMKERKAACDRYLWDGEEGFYFDYNWRKGERTDRWSLAAVVPLFFNMSSEKQAAEVASTLEGKFLMEGGLLTTLHETGQQWDRPNGWAPLHWMAVNGLLNYGFEELARTVAERWLETNRTMFERTGRMLEKYNVRNPVRKASGGEYENQDGFGWTNGVAIAMMRNSRASPRYRGKELVEFGP